MKLNYVKHGNGAKTLLLGHGFPFDHTMWDAQVEALAMDFTVIAPDFRGMGKSPASGKSITDMSDMADDLAELLTDLNVEKCVYCGLSMGGYVGMEFWNRHAERLEGLIFCDTNAKADTLEGATKRLETAEKIESEGSCAFMTDGMKGNLMTDETLRDAENPDGVYAVYAKMVRENNPVGVAAAARGMARRTDFTEKVREISVPVLVLTGEKDRLSPPDAMRQLAKRIPDAEFVVIPDAAHLAPMENAEAVNTAIKQFMNKK